MKFLVIGLYPEEGGKMQRFAEYYDATKASGAEAQCMFHHPKVIIAGVVTAVVVKETKAVLRCADKKRFTTL